MNTVSFEKTPTISGTHRSNKNTIVLNQYGFYDQPYSYTMGITNVSGTQQVFQDLFVHDSVQIASTWLKNVINDSKNTVCTLGVAAVRRTNLLMKLECTFKEFV